MNARKGCFYTVFAIFCLGFSFVIGCGGGSSPLPTPTQSAPSIASLSPTGAVAGGSAFTLSVSGSGFTSNSKIYWDGAARTTTYTSSTAITTAIAATDIASAGTVNVAVVDGDLTSPTVQFVIAPAPTPVPTITALSPNSVVINSPATSVSITGTQFASNATVQFGTTALTATVVSATTISAQVPASLLTTIGSYSITVTNPGSPSAVSAAATFQVTAPPPPPVPTIAALAPNSVVVNSAATSVYITGSQFASNATVQFGTTSLAATVVSASAITALVPASLLGMVGNYSITVTNPGSPASVSMAATFQVTAPPPPAITAISPTQILQGASAFTLQVTGQGFVAGSTVQWNGTALNTSFEDPTSLTATVPDALVEAAGVDTVTVEVPQSPTGVFTTPAASFTVTALPVGQFIVDQVANDIVSDEAHALIYASVPSTAAQYANDVIAIDPTTGKIVNSVSAGSSPNLLAISDDDQFLYVSLDGSSSVQRFVLPALTADINVSLGADSFFGPNIALDLSVAPGSPHTWAVTAGNAEVSPAAQAGLSVFDDATQRGASEGRNNYQGSGGFDFLLGTLTWGKDDTEIYGANNESTGFDFYTIPVTSTGPGAVTDYGGAMPGFNNAHIHFEPITGFVYGDNGYVVNPTNGAPVGQYPFSGSMVPDGTLGQAFFVSVSDGSEGAGLLTSFDLTHFTPTGTFTFPNFVGSPVRLVRWGATGIAMNALTNDYSGTGTTATGKIFIYSGAFVSAPAKVSAAK